MGHLVPILSDLTSPQKTDLFFSGTSLAQITRKYITKAPQGEWDYEMSQPPPVYLRYNPMGISSEFAPARKNPLKKKNGVARCPSLRQCVCDICGAILPYRLVAGSPQ
jgi:hypothetical protein